MTKGALFLVLVASSAPALSQLTSISSDNPLPKNGRDPNRVICERIQRTGSRLQFDTVCMTSTQWKEHSEGHRADVERVQQGVNQEPADAVGSRPQP